MQELKDELLSEHHGCLRLINELEMTARAELDQHWPRDARKQVRRLRDALAQHFRNEEHGWLFSEVPERYPRFAEPLARLQREHATLLQAFDAAHEHLQRAEHARDAADLTGAAAQLRAVLASLRRHEAEESELILCLQLEQLGAASPLPVGQAQQRGPAHGR